MKVFVGYGYNDRDKWIEEMIFPIIRAFGDDVVDGKVMPGEQIAEGVKERILRADVVLGFATRRIDPATGQLGQLTHRWVIQEIAIAFGAPNPPPMLEIREKEGDPQVGIVVGAQYLVYDPEHRDQFLVDFVKNFAALRERAGRFELHLMPDEFMKAVAPKLADRNLSCTYQLMTEGTWEEGREISTKIIRIKGGLFIRTGTIPRNSYIRLKVVCGQDFEWNSEFQPVDTRLIQLNPSK
jgi:hypothetical protein